MFVIAPSVFDFSNTQVVYVVSQFCSISFWTYLKRYGLPAASDPDMERCYVKHPPMSIVLLLLRSAQLDRVSTSTLDL